MNSLVDLELHISLRNDMHLINIFRSRITYIGTGTIKSTW